MNMDCLGSLAIMNIHRHIEIDYKEVVKKFFKLHPRKINENNLIYV